MYLYFLSCSIHIQGKRKNIKNRNCDCFLSTQEIANQINGPYLGRLLNSPGTQRISWHLFA